MTAGTPKPFRLFAVVALKRADFTERIISLKPEADDALRLARRIMVTMGDEFIRCRVRQMELTPAEVEAICFRWGQEDARSGEPVANELPGVYGRAYRAGFAAASGTGRGGR